MTEERLVRIEEWRKFIDREMEELKENTKMMNDRLENMSKTLLMIRNILIGGFLFALAEQLGWIKVIAKYLGL